MSTAIKAIIASVIAAEGGYVNDPADPGGETNYGITVAVARANGYSGAMKDMPRSFAEQVYVKRYVQDPKFDAVVAIDADIGAELIDTGVNMGPHRAAEFLQRWLNGFNDTGSRYQTLFVDGRLGPVSLSALEAFMKWRGRDGKTALLRGLNGIQATRYLEIAESRPASKRFLFGWVLHRVS
jgi:lysozyme family protein